MKMTITKIRTALRNRFGARRYQIRQDKSIIVYGQMPNTNIEGWYLYGAIEETKAGLVLQLSADLYPTTR